MSAQFVRRTVDLNLLQLHPTPLEVLNPENLVLDVLDSLLEQVLDLNMVHLALDLEDQAMDQTLALPRLDQTWIRDLESEI